MINIIKKDSLELFDAKIVVKILFCILLLFCCAEKINGQKQNYFPNIQYITSDDGLSQGEVTAILQDKKGFLWIGTRGGLNRYDGNSIKIFQNEVGNANSLINNSVETLFEDSKGRIWIGTKSNGVTIYNPEFDRFELFNSKLKELNKKNVISISEDSNNNIWIGTYGNGLHIFNPIENTIEHKHPNVAVFDILKAKDGKMWTATSNGIFVYNKKGNHIEDLRIEKVEITSIVEDEQSGLIYYVSQGSNFYSYDPSSKVSIEYRLNRKKRTNYHYLYRDKARNIWIGSWGGGTHRFNLDSKQLENFSLRSNQSKGSAELYNDVLSIFQDKTGNLWFGTNGGGLCRIEKNSNQFGGATSNNIEKNLPNEPIWSISKDQNNHLWVGIKGSNNIFYSENDKHFQKVKVPLGSEDSRNLKAGIKVIYQDLSGTIWMGGNQSLFEVSKTGNDFKINSIDLEKNNLNGKITTINQTRNGIFWVGTQKTGLRKSKKPGNPKNQEFEKHLENIRISAFLEDRSGQIWVGTYTGIELYQSSTNSFKRYHKSTNNTKSLSSDIIICLFQDSRGNVWIGTPNGLNKVIRNKDNSIEFSSFQVKDGLPNNYIQSILEDDHGNLWISTNKGISKFNIKDETFYNYDVNDGLQSNSFTEGAGFKGYNGKLYFGGIYGLNSFHPDSIKNIGSTSVILTGLKISGQEIRSGNLYNDRLILEKSINYTDEIVLTDSENIFSLEYAALDFSSSLHSYRFKMDGLEKEWQTSTQKSVIYSNLKPGDYIFKVKVIGDDSNNGSSVTSLKIEVLPPFSETWQAFVLYAILFIGLLYLFKYIITEQSVLKNNLELAKLERKKEEELTKMKTQFFTDIAHEFRTPLSLIAGPVETLLEKGLNEDERNGQLSTIQYHTKRLLSLIGQLLDFRKAESGKMTLQVATGNFANFSREIFLSFKDLAESKNVEFNLNIENNDTPLTYDRGKMEIVLCNLLSNAFKYTKTKIDMWLSIKGFDSSSSDFLPDFQLGYCEISVIDNGRGMSADVTERIFDRFYQNSNSETINQIGTGIGLALVKNIIELHKGHVFVNSELNKGSQFIIQLPLGEVHFSKDQFISDYKKAEDPVHYQVERILSDFDETEIKVDSELPTLLIVEDNPEIRSYIKIIFQSTYKVIEAENGLVGLEKALKYIPEIIITDLMMPKMDGMTLCHELSENEHTLQIPIIMLTARTATVYKEKGYNSGADIFVTKPFNPSVLKAQVEGLLKSRTKLKDYFGKKITLLPTELDHTSVDEEFLNRVMKLVEDNLTNEKLNRDFLASKMAVSTSTLYRKIKSITDLDITFFIRSIRLKKAAQMIQNKEDNISGIAYHVGFNDPNYFTKCFIKQFGVTPSKYGKNIESNK